jgi:hypothetical protein
VAFLSDRCFVIDDEVASREAHEYRWLLHTNAAIESTDRGARLKQPKAALIVRRVAPRDANTSARGRGISVWPRKKHRSARFLHVLFPVRSGDPEPAIRVEGETALRLERQGVADVYFAAPGAAFGVETDAGAAAVADAKQTTAGAVLIREGRRLTLGGRPLLEADRPVTAAVSVSGSAALCFVQAAAETRLRLRLPFPPAAVEAVDLDVPWEAEGTTAVLRIPAGACRIALRGEEAK